MSDTCKRHLLSRNGIGSIEGCTCGAVHLCLGPFTLRLEVPAFLALCDVVGRAHQGMTGVARQRAMVGVSAWAPHDEGVQ